jgi:hypothetical protein
MSKRQIERAAQKASATLRKHVGELVQHTLAVSEYNARGHAEGKQRRAGHVMPKSDMNLQTGAHLSSN